MKRLYLLTLISVVLAILVFMNKRAATTIAAGEGLVIKKAWLVANRNIVTRPEYVRPPDQTFLTFPEWYLVFSPEEQAHYFKKRTATGFPFTSHTAQIWESYKIVNDQIRDNFPYNGGYHFMIWVIGSSASVEYSIKALYEQIIGRITDTKEVVTAEDEFNATFTQDYVDFIKIEPWYKFDFKKQLAVLWSDTPVFGDHVIRKLERRYILTSELLAKLGYGKLIGLGTQTVYEVALPTTEVLVAGSLNGATFPVVKRYNDSLMLISLPRYDQFKAAAVDVSVRGMNFVEIAGNNSAVLLTILIPADMKMQLKEAQIVFTQSITSDPIVKRVALAVPVPALSKVLLELSNDGVEIEHIFDF